MKKLRIRDYDLGIKKILHFPFYYCFGLGFIFIFTLSLSAQSTSPTYPTAVSSNEINGKVAARDIGDPRLTTYYYVFNGNQGDIFVNVLTNNLDGDVDIFTANGLKPLTKIKVYSDAPDNETGRVIYLRQPEKLILRIEGRTPNDEPGTYRIKFAGGFSPITNVAETEEPKLPEVKGENQTDVQVNSVGTIIAVKPKPTPSPKEVTGLSDTEIEKSTEGKIEKPVEDEKEREQNQADREISDAKRIDESKGETKDAKPPVVVITDNLPKKEQPENPTDDIKKETEEDISVNKVEPKPKKKPGKNTSEVNPLAGINLVILFKNGTEIKRPMSEILRVAVDRGVLTIISKDGTVGRYPILDVSEMTIK